ncbi:TonB-dependent siderophore receptor [Stutzerimonas kirkiae]|uniref:TonB-dependent siderophore receptor n=1 Tax=Stutzerimonas kirkiae TaxID=2211392 RepID=A0A4Q9R3M3_9GAMM|nr:TonB-dependent siderophore receptor [Stutzerimonas kirkiae]TBV06136.1 TonB-dependent siderophore receptor [Stutzerimonas kirkiae]TBV13699.1 TonB-dependent siderophore receptor [Stutzerimonas kirkiae]
MYANPYRQHLLNPLALAVLLACPGLAMAAEAPLELQATQVLGTAEEELKQALGVSIITEEDIRKGGAVNDIAEIIRKQPGVNLTGNSGSGARGNNRQIDIRGMGPENTLILIDGKPVSSRNAVRYGWRGDRDTRGDTNWVPAEQIERIEVLRGPAAARYGSGAAGGVVNIITKKAGIEHHGNLSLYTSVPQHDEEGATRRINFGLSGPLADNLSYRVYGNLNKTDSDAADINEGRAVSASNAALAGREGVRNRDVDGTLSWRIDDSQTLDLQAGFSRQGNIYTGDSMNNLSGSAVVDNYRGAWLDRETNRMYRNTYSVTHHGDWDFGSTLNYLQYERTRNNRLKEGLAGGPEGAIYSTDFGTIELESLTAHSEVSLPLSGLFEQVVTLGAEWSEQRMEDGVSDLAAIQSIGYPTRFDGGISVRTASLFIEDNIELLPGTILTPGLRFDHNSLSGSNWSPSLNLSQRLGEGFTFKAGIARAYKSPNLYQSNPSYALYSNGIGCWDYAGVGCFLVGSDKLDAETSVNKELGLEFESGDLHASFTWFRNDYRDKVEAGREPVGTVSFTQGNTTRVANVFQWVNIPRAVVEGFEGNLKLPLAASLDWNTNFTYMLQSKNKETGEPLSIIPEFTVNSTLDWQVTDPLSLQATVTWYGRQTPGKYDYQGNVLSGDARREISPYALAGLSGSYELSRNWSLGAGVSNLFDKRLYREGNAREAGAYTYNEPGRTFYASVSTSF